MLLKNSTVRRGGATSSRWYGETQVISGSIAADGLRFSFTLPSKGGGETQIQFDVGTEDLRMLLKMLATVDLEFATTLADCTKIAVVSLLKANK